jgi:hypothetical protein
MPQPLSLDQIEKLLPIASEWAAEQEQLILREGVPLSEEELSDARALGVRNPERVRLLQVDAIPEPTHPMLRTAYLAMNFLTGAPRGLALQYGIFVRSDYWRDNMLITHELVHTAQYERAGGILPFLRGYLSQCFAEGYRAAPLEQEASGAAHRICSAKREACPT